MSDETSENSAKATKQKRLFITIGIICLVIIAFIGFRWLTEWRYLIETEDAYVGGDIAAIASKLNTYISDVPVETNQPVKKGDVLFRLDAGDYQLALDDAKAKLATQQQSLTRINSQIEAAQSSLQEANAALEVTQAVQINAQLNFDRIKKLQTQQYVSKSQLDMAQSDLSQANANVDRSKAQIANAKANIAVLHAQYDETVSQTKSLEIARNQAERNLSFTVIRAPFDGIIGNMTGKKGDFVANGQRLAALVPTDQLYIDANYKETQIAEIYGGETAYISVDGFEGGEFEGKVISLAPATGSVFSVLPPQNATGNFTKVVQRVPVRIAIPKKVLDTGRIRAGMSVIVQIDKRTKPKNAVPLTKERTQAIKDSQSTKNEPK